MRFSISVIPALLLQLSSLLTSCSTTREAIKPATEVVVTRVACIGNSITYGSGIEDREVNAYPSQLGRMLGDDWHVPEHTAFAKLLEPPEFRHVKMRVGHIPVVIQMDGHLAVSFDTSDRVDHDLP